MSYVVKHTQCPTCAKLGRDTSKDNLAIYSDGGEHCFGCGYHVFPNKITTFLKKSTEEHHHSVFLPEDIEASYPASAVKWVEQYEITPTILQTQKVLWSNDRQLLVFPYYNNHQLKAWQGRYFGSNENHPKWITYGAIHSFDYFLGQPKDSCIVVEDIISAIKLSKYQQVLPLFGSHLSKTKLLTIKKRCNTLIIWLDPDMYKKSLEFQSVASLYFENVYVILADKDPKELTHQSIGELFDSKSLNYYS